MAIGALAVANFVAEGENGGAGPFAVTSVFAVLAAVVLFGRVVPRAMEGPRRRAHRARAGRPRPADPASCSGAGCRRCSAPAAIVLGLAAPRNGESIAAIGIGSIAYVASLVACVIG